MTNSAAIVHGQGSARERLKPAPRCSAGS